MTSPAESEHRDRGTAVWAEQLNAVFRRELGVIREHRDYDKSLVDAWPDFSRDAWNVMVDLQRIDEELGRNGLPPISEDPLLPLLEPVQLATSRVRQSCFVGNPLRDYMETGGIEGQGVVTPEETFTHVLHWVSEWKERTDKDADEPWRGIEEIIGRLLTYLGDTPGMSPEVKEEIQGQLSKLQQARQKAIAWYESAQAFRAETIRAGAHAALSTLEDAELRSLPGHRRKVSTWIHLDPEAMEGMLEVLPEEERARAFRTWMSGGLHSSVSWYTLRSGLSSTTPQLSPSFSPPGAVGPPVMSDKEVLRFWIDQGRTSPVETLEFFWHQMVHEGRVEHMRSLVTDDEKSLPPDILRGLTELRDELLGRAMTIDPAAFATYAAANKALISQGEKATATPGEESTSMVLARHLRDRVSADMFIAFMRHERKMIAGLSREPDTARITPPVTSMYAGTTDRLQVAIDFLEGDGFSELTASDRDKVGVAAANLVLEARVAFLTDAPAGSELHQWQRSHSKILQVALNEAIARAAARLADWEPSEEHVLWVLGTAADDKALWTTAYEKLLPRVGPPATGRDHEDRERPGGARGPGTRRRTSR